MKPQDLESGPRAWRRAERWTVVAIVVLASIFPVDLFPGSPRSRNGLDGQLSGKQGQVLLVRVPAPSTAATGQFLGRTIPFFHQDGATVGLLGLDMQDPPGTHELTIHLRNGEATNRLSYHVLVVKEKYPIQHLKLPKDKVDLDEETLDRVKTEQERVKETLAKVLQERIWNGSFVEPVRGSVSGAFGRMRVINGQSRNPHNGEDIAAPEGTDVVAMNDGIVRLTVDHFFSGKGVFLDHGLGFYSMYFHLADIAVKEGESVRGGQVIGTVGATGRASGPHLHWGVRLNGARVNPYALLALRLPDPDASELARSR